jgi:NAD(P)-dependent dehydrogenase (short-subunit alcohol dehydrogenase family)
MDTLRGKVIVGTGAGGGIGRAACLLIARRWVCLVDAQNYRQCPYRCNQRAQARSMLCRFRP